MKVEWLSFGFFVFAGILQIILGFFEMVMLNKPQVLNFYGLHNVSAETGSFFKFRFVIHIFLVLMLIVGLRYIFQGQVRMAGVVTGFAGLGMMLSGFGLWWSKKGSLKVALVEAVPVLLGFFFLLFHIIPAIRASQSGG